MNKHILDEAVQSFITEHLNSDVSKIALSKNIFENISNAELANQIVAKKKSEKKLPTWFNTANIYYPASLSIEQTSSEVTASYKAKLIKGSQLIDITGGFGIDSFYFSKNIAKVTHCEINIDLSAIAKHNATKFGLKNINFIADDGLAYLKNSPNRYDTIYIDPARRAEKGKVFLLSDCTPNVVEHLEFLLSKCQRLIIKTAPLLDISAGLSELKNVSEIHIVSVKNECKEILWVLDKDYSGEITMYASTLNDLNKTFSFQLGTQNTKSKISTQLENYKYLYEPDTALLKTGNFNLIGENYNLEKLNPQTHLYTSNSINTLFPGRIFEIEGLVNASELKKAKDIKSNVIVRNYPAKADQIVKKYNIKPANEDFLIFCTNSNNQPVIIRAKIIQYY